jgi:glycosyltransferase involved in cell wall biosynthesis
MHDPAGHAPTPSTVALVHYTAPPVVGGVECVLGHHARLIADAGHRVRIIAGRGRSLDPRIAFARVPRADSRHPAVLRFQGELDAGRVPRGFDRAVAALADRLAGALAGVDVLVAHNICSLNRNLALTAAIHDIARRPDAPRLLIWHHDLAWTLPAYRPTLHAGYPWDLLRTPVPGAEQVTISPARQADLAALLAIPLDAIRVIPNGVDLAALLGLGPATIRLVRATGLASFDPLVLLPARVTARKNIGLALRAVAEMRRRGRPSAGLVVTGPVDPHDSAGGAYLAELRALRHALALDEGAVFLADVLAGLAPDALVHDLYRLADLLLFPSRDEGFGLPILEAAVSRLPIVCADLPVLRDLAGGAAVYVDPDADPGAVAALALARLDGDPSAVLARRVRTECSWEAVYRRAIAPLLDRP